MSQAGLRANRTSDVEATISHDSPGHAASWPDLERRFLGNERRAGRRAVHDRRRMRDDRPARVGDLDRRDHDGAGSKARLMRKYRGYFPINRARVRVWRDRLGPLQQADCPGFRVVQLARVVADARARLRPRASYRSRVSFPPTRRCCNSAQGCGSRVHQAGSVPADQCDVHHRDDPASHHVQASAQRCIEGCAYAAHSRHRVAHAAVDRRHRAVRHGRRADVEPAPAAAASVTTRTAISRPRRSARGTGKGVTMALGAMFMAGWAYGFETAVCYA